MQEHDTRTISTFEKYVIGMNVLTQAQVDGAKGVQKALAERGVRKSLEEIALLKGLLDADQMGSLLADIKAKWKISIPRPVLYSITDEKDRALQELLVQQSPKDASHVLECRKIQQEAQALGIGFKVSELLIAKGYYAPPGAAAPAAAIAPEDRSIDDLLPDDPPAAAKKPMVVAPPPRRPAGPAPRKPVPAGRPTARPGARERDEEPAPPAKKKHYVLWGAIGGMAALVLVAIIIVVATSGGTEPAPAPVADPRPKKKQILLKLEGADRVPVYSEDNLLEMHATDDPKTLVQAGSAIPAGTPVKLLHQLRTNRNLWFHVRTDKGTEGWVYHSAIQVVNGDLSDESVPDYTTDWSEKIAARKGAPPKPLAKAPDVPRPAEPAAAPAAAPPRPAEPAKPAEPEPAAPAPAVPAREASLVAHWAFDEGSGTSTADAASRNPAAKVNGALWGPGAVARALGFDGVDDHVVCPAHGVPAANEPQSVAGWYAVATVPTNVQTMVLLEGAGSSVQVGFRDSKLAVWKRGGQVLVSTAAPSDPRPPAQGLLGVYYSRPNLTEPSLQRYDPQVNFDWGQGAPDPSMPPDGFSVRWKGFVEPLHSETYTFYALTDDGVRLWVDRKPVFDNWGPQMPSETKGTIDLKARTKVEIMLEYFENTGGAISRLSWSSPSQPKQIIPAERMSPPPAAWHHFAYTFDGTTHRLYVDGGLRNASSAAPDAGAVTKVELGRWEGQGLKEYFKGMLDDIHLYSGALSQQEIRNLAPDAGVALAAAGQPSAGPAGGPKPAAGPRPPPSSDPKQGEREKKAQALWDAALDYEKQGKFADAQTALRNLRTRFRTTSVYFDHSIEISDKINEFGLKLAGQAIGKTALYKKAHMDSWYSYEFVPPLDWKGVPPQPNWFGEQDNDETYLRGKTYQVARYTAPYLDKLYMVILKTFACDSMEMLQSKVVATVETRMKGLKEEASSPASGKMPFARKTYSTPAGDRAVIYFYFQDRRGLALLCTWRAGGSEDFGVSITIIDSSGTTTMKTKEHPVSDEHWASALKVFDQCAKTFWIYDPATRQGKQVQLDRSALCADWNILRSAKGWYVIEYATRPDFAKRAGEEMEQIMALYKQVLPTQKAIPPCRVKLFDREDDFQYYSGAWGAAAYWSPGQEEIVAYRFEGDKLKVDSKEEFTIAEDKNPEDVTFKILYHEGFHQYMHFYMGRARDIYVPSWLNEGLGDYFFGGDWSKDKRKFSIGLNDWRLKKIYDAVKKGDHVGIDKIIRYEQMQYYNNASLCYAEGWALNYFFQQSEAARKKGYHLLPQKMLQELKTGGNWEKATDRTFAGIDLKKMEEEWKEFVLALPVPKEKEEAK
jgi:hypothetical protein